MIFFKKICNIPFSENYPIAYFLFEHFLWSKNSGNFLFLFLEKNRSLNGPSIFYLFLFNFYFS